MNSIRSILLLLLLSASAVAFADDAVPESEDYGWHIQSTFISQQHGRFNAPYSGGNSLQDAREVRNSFTTTIFLGARVWNGGEVYFNPEFAMGRGLSNVTGIAGFPNGEISRVSGANLTAYRARLFLRQTWGLGGDKVTLDSDQNQLAGLVDAQRIVLTVGNFSAIDVFDDNTYSHEPRTQFLNWSLYANAAWDYPADARGYTQGAALEWITPDWAVRGGVMLMPEAANGLPLDRRASRANGAVVELERDYRLGDRPGAVRLLTYLNRADMGDYAQAVATPGVPDITLSRTLRSKHGVGLNFEQELADAAGLFGRAGWNDGKTETFAFTEIDRTVSVGLSLKGKAWDRSTDGAGIALAVNGLSKAHRTYLADGGLGFIVGDGRLRYGTENILEAYYALGLTKVFTVSVDFQHIVHPAYNRDRGPVDVASARLHAAF